MKSRISCGENIRVTARKAKNPITLPEVVLREDPKVGETAEESEDPEEVVTRAEARAREDQKKAEAKRSSKCIGSKREYAESLHRQADFLHHRGDYEAALVLYHRATTAYPRDPSHGVAVRRTSAAISSATNPSGALKKTLPRTKNAAQLAANYCPETAALRARKLVEESSDPVSAIDQILKYFDSRKDFWRDPPTFQDRRRTTLVSRSKIMLRQLSAMANAALQKLQASFASGDSNASLKIGEELLVISAALPDRFRYQVAARHYLAMTQIFLGRHDRAVDQASRMVRIAKESGDVALRSRSMMTLGRVHLSFRHLEAAAKAWERLVTDVEDAVPKAWLLHEIGRCYFEMKRYSTALETAGRCLEYADEGNSRKWLLHGKLLRGQALVELGRLGEAVQVLKVASQAAREEEDQSTVEYVTDLIDRVTGLLRRAVCLDEVVEMKDKGAKREDKAWKVKSENTLRHTKPLELSREKGKNLSGTTKKSKIIDSKSFRRKTKSLKCARRKNVRAGRARTRRKNMGKIENSILTIYPSRGSGTFDLSVPLEDDVNPSETSTMRITSSERYPRETDLSTCRRRDDDETGSDLSTSRTRVIRTKNENSSEKSEYLDRNEINVEKDQAPNSGSEQSNRSGVTYVVHELRKFSITEDKAWGSSDDRNLELCHRENENSVKTAVTRVLDNSYSSEYLMDERTNDLEISRLRACLCDEGIDEEEEDEEEVRGSSLNHRESQISPASTGKTYLVDDGKKMSYISCAMSRRYVDYEETMRNERNYSHSSNISPERNTRRNIDSRIKNDIIETIGDSPNDSIVEEQKKSRNVTNLSVQQSLAEIREKLNSSEVPTRSSFFSERRENDTQRIRSVFEEQLATSESISTPRRYGFVSSIGKHSLYRHSLPTSPRKAIQPEFP